MKPLSKSLLIIFIFLKISGQAQVLNGLVPFSAGTPFLEPDGRKSVVKVSSNEFVVISKVKGGLNGESDYNLEKHNASLNSVFTVPLKFSSNEDILQLYYNDSELILYTIIHDQSASESKLMAYAYDPGTGSKLWDKLLMQHKVTSYQSVRYRGGVEESFENAVCSGLNKNFIVPFQYQYQISYSPDGNKMIAYTFDYSKPNMVGYATVFDKKHNKISEGIVPIDNNFINYGVFINNRGEVYILNVDRLGRIVVVQFNMETKDNKLLDIQYASTQRQGLKLHFHNDDEVFVGCINVNEGRLVGVMYAKFNFSKNLVEKINFHDFTEGLLQTADLVREGKFKTAENWQHFELTDFIVNKFEKVLMVLEKREITAPEYSYESETILEADKWKERMGKVNVESIVMISFNSNDELMWENYYAKSQVADLTTGLTSASFILDANDERIRMIYASSDNPAGVFNTINFVEWDAQNGNKTKELQLQNDENLALVRNYSVLWEDKAVLVGRKGLLGKKYMISLYKFSDGN